MINRNDNRTLPTANCPRCGRTIIYSSNPKKKLNVILRIADETCGGNALLCSKCKTMLSVIEKPRFSRRLLALSLLNVR